MAYGELIEVYPRYIHPEGDSLFIVAHIGNPKENLATVYAKLNNTAQTYQDSIPLFDDGMHGVGVLVGVRVLVGVTVGILVGVRVGQQ